MKGAAAHEATAIDALFRSAKIGIAWADCKQFIRFKRGALADHLELNEPLCEQIAACFGMEKRIEALQGQERACLTLPRIAFICEAEKSEKFSIDIIWDRQMEGYLVLFSPSDIRLDAEQLITRQLRVKRMAEESFQSGLDLFSIKGALADAIAQLRAPARDLAGPIPAFSRHQENPLDRLTKREREVVQLLVKGRSNKLIAHDLKISKKTVEAHRSRAIKRLGLKTSADLIRIAVEFGASR